ncbi:Monooxygenase [Pseudocercospora fuligena]|uniref:Monooxygenase n=1 Tax=Pseudocercospora fuligena TaxID=685502 RepID=A0A8H6RWA7_9PEZI|nr:Monooxygenase [Pseudocercospora fuligena]
MAFQAIYNPFSTRPRAQMLKDGQLIGFHATLRDNFSIGTWLLFGAAIQAILFNVLPYRNIVLVLPIFLILGFKLLKTTLETVGILPNPYMKGVTIGRTVPVFPDEKGVQNTPAGDSLCVIMLAVRSNHPLGMLAPGYKEIGDRFAAMVKQLDATASTSGFLGASSWNSTHDRITSSETMSIIYFKNDHYLHEFSHGPLHTEAMQWWRDLGEKNRHLGIMHEVYSCPKNSWEGIYDNYHPTGLGATTKQATVNGQQVWVNPLVRGKGKLVYSKGRMGRTIANNEWDAFEQRLDAEEKAEIRS